MGRHLGGLLGTAGLLILASSGGQAQTPLRINLVITITTTNTGTITVTTGTTTPVGGTATAGSSSAGLGSTATAGLGSAGLGSAATAGLGSAGLGSTATAGSSSAGLGSAATAGSSSATAGSGSTAPGNTTVATGSSKGTFGTTATGSAATTGGLNLASSNAPGCASQYPQALSALTTFQTMLGQGETIYTADHAAGVIADSAYRAGLANLQGIGLDAGAAHDMVQIGGDAADITTQLTTVQAELGAVTNVDMTQLVEAMRTQLTTASAAVSASSGCAVPVSP